MFARKLTVVLLYSALVIMATPLNTHAAAKYKEIDVKDGGNVTRQTNL